MNMLYDYSECDEIADNMPKPKYRLSFSEALVIVNRQMPDETFTVRSNVAEALVRRSRGHTMMNGDVRAPIKGAEHIMGATIVIKK